MAMSALGSGLSDAKHHEDALPVKEAELAMLRRLGTPEESILITQSNLANTYHALGRNEEALRMRRDVFSGCVRLNGEEHKDSLHEANNCAMSLNRLQRFKEAKSLLRKTIPVARRVLGENNERTLRMRWIYARTLYEDPCATLDDLRETLTTLEEIEPVARRVLGGAHPITVDIERDMRNARDAVEGG